MTVDTAQHISEFNLALPTSADPQAEGDDNFRMVKTVLKTDFPNISSAMTLTSAVINALPADIATVQTNLDTEAARLDAADLAVQDTLNTTISDGDDIVRGEFAAADTATYNSAINDAGAAADAADVLALDALRGEVTIGKTVLANFNEIASVDADLQQHKIDQLAIDNTQNESIVSINDAIAGLTGSDTELPAAKQYTDEQIISLRGQATHATDVTVKANKDKITTNTTNISTNTTNIATNTTDIATNVTAIGINTNNISNHEARISTLEGGDPLTMQAVFDIAHPVGSVYWCEYNRNIPDILTNYGNWDPFEYRGVVYHNAYSGDAVSSGYNLVGPQLNDSGGQPSQSVMNTTPLRAYVRKS